MNDNNTANEPTTEASAGSTSSINPATSIPFDDLTRLGDRIVHETGLATSTDTVGRWLAHRLAELMEQANLARGTPSEAGSAQACQEAVLDLWRHRSTWPQGWPPPVAREIAAMLDDAKGPEQTAWNRGTSVVAHLQALHHQVLAALVDLLAGSVDTTEEHTWLDKFSDFLNEDERALLRRVADAPRPAIFAESQVKDPESRLIDLAQQYQSTAATLVEAVHNALEENG